MPFMVKICWYGSRFTSIFFPQIIVTFFKSVIKDWFWVCQLFNWHGSHDLRISYIFLTPLQICAIHSGVVSLCTGVIYFPVCCNIFTSFTRGGVTLAWIDVTMRWFAEIRWTLYNLCNNFIEEQRKITFE